MESRVNPIHRLSPQMRQPATIPTIMGDVLIALLPSVAMSVYFFGFRVLVLASISVLSCILFEYAYRRLTHQRQTIGDLSACVTGLLLAMCLPATSSYWAPVLGSAFAIIVVKQFYGGLGKNFMNPALAGRMLLTTFPMLMTTWSAPLDRLPLLNVDAVAAATPMSYLHEGVLPPQSLDQLFLGFHGGCMGEVSSFMLLLGGVYLILRRVISPRIPLAYLGSVALLTFLFHPANVNPFVWMLSELLSGGLMLGAFFLATDPTTTPVTPRGHLLFGLGCGCFTFLLRYFGSYPEGAGWAILTMNCCVWLLDRAGLPRRFGEPHFSVLLRWWNELRSDLSQIRFVMPKLPSLRGGKAPGEEQLDLIRSYGKSAVWLAGVVLAAGVSIYSVHSLIDLQTAQAANEAQQQLLAQVMPQAATRTETPYLANDALSITAGYSSENELVGYCVEVQSNGFGGVLTLVVGVDLDGKVTGVAVTDHNESSGMGTQALTPLALRRYIGKSGTIRPSGINSVNAVSGATATSKAITAGVNKALAIIANLDTEGDELYYEGQP